ncbi:hypothetical protein EVA_04166 [gut metagenome]|uniref:Uncharacterized protein n=1 Tax=gut metagenome TaxID=749906 RepID=J9GK83_9ZZZZ
MVFIFHRLNYVGLNGKGCRLTQTRNAQRGKKLGAIDDIHSIEAKEAGDGDLTGAHLLDFAKRYRQRFGKEDTCAVGDVVLPDGKALVAIGLGKQQ